MSSTKSSENFKSLPPNLANACRAITALLGKISHAAEKLDQYKRSIGQHIAAIKAERPGDWLAVVKAECDLGRRSAYSYLALVNGTKTAEQQRAANAAANRRLRQRAPRDAQSPPRPDPQAHIDEAAREHDQGLAEQLRVAEIRIIGLESQVAELKVENATLRQQLAEAAAPESKKKTDKGKARASRHDAFGWWASAPHEERIRFIEAIGLNPLLAVMPPAWSDELACRFLPHSKPEVIEVPATELAPEPSPLDPNDPGDIPEFLLIENRGKPLSEFGWIDWPAEGAAA